MALSPQVKEIAENYAKKHPTNITPFFSNGMFRIQFQFKDGSRKRVAFPDQQRQREFMTHVRACTV